MKRVRIIKQPPDCLIKHEVIVSESFPALLEKRWPGCFESEPVELRHAAGHDLNGKTVLVMRYAGYGDHLWITRIVRELKERYPKAIFDVAARDNHLSVWANNPDVRRLIPYPIPAKAFDEADYHLSWEEVLQKDRTGKNVYDMFAEVAGISMEARPKSPIYTVPGWARKNAKKWFREWGFSSQDKVVMIHMGSTTPWKSWPAEYCLKLGLLLWNHGAKVILAGNKNTFPFRNIPPLPGLVQTCYRVNKRRGGRDNFCSMEESVAMMEKCSLLVGQDSALTHFSAALGTPCVAMYGPFPARAYVSTYPNVEPAEPVPGVCDRMPCFPHMDNRCPYQDEKGYSKCQKSVLPETVAEIAIRKLGLPEIPQHTKILDLKEEKVNA